MKYKYTDTTKFKIGSTQTDTKTRLNLKSIAEVLQETAINHADKSGFGYYDMQKIGLFWILTRMKILVHKLPKWKDTIIAETWVVNKEKFFTRRDFEIKNEKGELLISAISGWMLIETKNKRPQFTDVLPIEMKMIPDRLAVNQEINKISEMSSVLQSDNYNVRYSDLDFINHVNNTQYYRIILDTYDIDFREQFVVKSFEINYLAEAFYNDTLEINTENLSENNEYKHEIIRPEDGKIICRAVVAWQSLNI